MSGSTWVGRIGEWVSHTRLPCPSPAILPSHTQLLLHSMQCFPEHPTSLPYTRLLLRFSAHTPNIGSYTHPAGRCLVTRVMPGLSASASLSVICSGYWSHTTQLLYYVGMCMSNVCMYYTKKHVMSSNASPQPTLLSYLSSVICSSSSCYTAFMFLCTMF